MAKVNHRATLDVTPDQLPMISALLPDGFHITGSESMIGVVRLVLEGPGVTEDAHLEAIVTNDGNARQLSLSPKQKPPSNG